MQAVIYVVVYAPVTPNIESVYPADRIAEEAVGPIVEALQKLSTLRTYACYIDALTYQS